MPAVTLLADPKRVVKAISTVQRKVDDELAT